MVRQVLRNNFFFINFQLASTFVSLFLEDFGWTIDICGSVFGLAYLMHEKNDISALMDGLWAIVCLSHIP